MTTEMIMPKAETYPLVFMSFMQPEVMHSSDPSDWRRGKKPFTNRSTTTRRSLLAISLAILTVGCATSASAQKCNQNTELHVKLGVIHFVLPTALAASVTRRDREFRSRNTNSCTEGTPADPIVASHLVLSEYAASDLEWRQRMRRLGIIQIRVVTAEKTHDPRACSIEFDKVAGAIKGGEGSLSQSVFFRRGTSIDTSQQKGEAIYVGQFSLITGEAGKDYYVYCRSSKECNYYWMLSKDVCVVSYGSSHVFGEGSHLERYASRSRDRDVVASEIHHFLGTLRMQ